MKDRIAISLIILMFPVAAFAGAGSSVREGNAQYKKGEYDNALKSYRDAEIAAPSNPAVHFNLGDALYKTEKVEDAQNEFNKALSSKDPKVRAKAYYNLGNSAYRNQKNDEALDYYKKSLKLNPYDNDTKYNLEYLTKVKNQPQKKDKDQKKKNQDKKDKQKQQPKEGQGEQEKKKGGMSKEDAKRILQSFDDADKNSKNKRRTAQPPMPKTDEDW